MTTGNSDRETIYNYDQGFYLFLKKGGCAQF